MNHLILYSFIKCERFYFLFWDILGVEVYGNNGLKKEWLILECYSIASLLVSRSLREERAQLLVWYPTTGYSKYCSQPVWLHSGLRCLQRQYQGRRILKQWIIAVVVKGHNGWWRRKYKDLPLKSRGTEDFVSRKRRLLLSQSRLEEFLISEVEHFWVRPEDV